MLKERCRQVWKNLTIRKKIITFTGMVFFIIIASLVFDFWVVRFSLYDFQHILADNAMTNEVVQTCKKEAALFEQYMKNQNEENKQALMSAMQATQRAIKSLPFEYVQIGEKRYADTWSLHNSYEVYVKKRDAMLVTQEGTADYIQSLYEVYEMQDYLQQYAQRLMNDTLEAGNQVYQSKVPQLRNVPRLVIVFGAFILWGMVKLAKVMNQTIMLPVMKLVKASKKIAENDFFIDDVETDNQDELGELVHAFNKMKYATGVYITALEDQRVTLDKLHAEELEKVEMQRRLEAIHLELLKSQIRPHFLFNTLNVIAGMANLEDAQTTEKMINALSSLFRYNLKTPEVEVVLARELKVVEDYMYLQQMRFGSRVSYEIQCEVDKERVMLPSFCLQPLVENAIIHGLAPKEEGGKIMLHIWEYGDMIRISVNDTGVGMKQEELEKLRARMEQQEEKHQGIGISNVYHRVKTLYEGSMMEIFSRFQEGTLIQIAIPKDCLRGGI